MRTLMHSALAFSLMAHACFATDDSISSAFEDHSDEVSLADLADMNVDDIAELRYETLPSMIPELEVIAAGLEETRNKDDERRFIATFELKIVSVKAVLSKFEGDKESLIGKTLTEKFYIDPAAEPEKIREAIGRIRAFVGDIGCDNTGALGALVENTKGHIFANGKIVHQKDRVDKSIIYARLKVEAPKKK